MNNNFNNNKEIEMLSITKTKEVPGCIFSWKSFLLPLPPLWKIIFPPRNILYILAPIWIYFQGFIHCIWENKLFLRRNKWHDFILPPPLKSSKFISHVILKNIHPWGGQYREIYIPGVFNFVKCTPLGCSISWNIHPWGV